MRYRFLFSHAQPKGFHETRHSHAVGTRPPAAMPPAGPSKNATQECIVGMTSRDEEKIVIPVQAASPPETGIQHTNRRDSQFKIWYKNNA